MVNKLVKTYNKVLNTYINFFTQRYYNKNIDNCFKQLKKAEINYGNIKLFKIDWNSLDDEVDFPDYLYIFKLFCIRNIQSKYNLLGNYSTFEIYHFYKKLHNQMMQESVKHDIEFQREVDANEEQVRRDVAFDEKMKKHPKLKAKIKHEMNNIHIDSDITIHDSDLPF